MPRFYLDIVVDSDAVADEAGFKADDLTAARRIGVLNIAELLKTISHTDSHMIEASILNDQRTEQVFLTTMLHVSFPRDLNIDPPAEDGFDLSVSDASMLE